MVTDNIKDLILNGLTEEQLTSLEKENKLPPNELWLTPDIESDTNIAQKLEELVLNTETHSTILQQLQASLNNYLLSSGGTLTGKLSFNSNNAIPEDTSLDFIVGLESFASGGNLKYINKNNFISMLGQTFVTKTSFSIRQSDATAFKFYYSVDGVTEIPITLNSSHSHPYSAVYTGTSSTQESNTNLSTLRLGYTSGNLYIWNS